MIQNRQSGNMLFIILVAIVLLGGLAVLLTRTASNTEDTGRTEQASIAASKIMRTTGGFANGIQRMLSQGCSESNLSFESAGWPRYNNTTAPSDKSCHLFDQSGGGLTYSWLPTSYVDTTYSAAPYYGYWVFMGVICIDDVGPVGGTNCKSAAGNPNELLVVAAFLRKDICQEINRILGVGTTIPTIVGAPWPAAYQDGVYNTVNKFQPTPYPGMAAGLSGRKSACFETAALPGTYHYYHVLIAR